MRRAELFIAVGCAAGVLLLGPTRGIVLALLATIVDMVRRLAASPAVTLEAPTGGWETGRFASAVTSDDDGNPVQQPDEIEFIRLSGPLFFANADTLRARAVAAAGSDDHWVVLDFESVTDVDPTAYEALTDVVGVLDEAGKTTAISRATASIRELLDRYGFAAVLPPERYFESNRAALAAFEVSDGPGS
jgi:MFS superfamily sulfate permease-like transporter